jgi:hypothetical protein
LLVATGVVAYFNSGRSGVAKPIGVVSAGHRRSTRAVHPAGTAWWLVADKDVDRALGSIWGRLLREAASDVLPISSHVGRHGRGTRGGSGGSARPSGGLVHHRYNLRDRRPAALRCGVALRRAPSLAPSKS